MGAPATEAFRGRETTRSNSKTIRVEVSGEVRQLHEVYGGGQKAQTIGQDVSWQEMGQR